VSFPEAMLLNCKNRRDETAMVYMTRKTNKTKEGKKKLKRRNIAKQPGCCSPPGPRLL
jgi:hypothetical protein